jgi:hypothetical protein
MGAGPLAPPVVTADKTNWHMNRAHPLPFAVRTEQTVLLPARIFDLPCTQYSYS